VKFPWSRNDSSAVPASAPDESASGQKCPALGKALDKVLKTDKPEILDLGPFCGATAVFLADRGARVSVEGFDPPPPPKPAPRPASGELAPAEVEDEASPPLRLDQPDGKFDLVLVWEMCDYVHPQRLAEFGAELNRVVADGGWVLLMSTTTPPREGPAARRPPRYRVLGDELVERESTEGPEVPRYAHKPRDIERALAPLSVQGIHLQRNQLREFLLHKPARSAGR
jgi:SAM-dependent methyltransferase